MSTVHRCAKDPYRNGEWFESENAWQAIATMIEVSNAVKVNNRTHYCFSQETQKRTKLVFMFTLMVHVMDFSIIVH